MTSPYNNAVSYPITPRHQSVGGPQMHIGLSNTNSNFPKSFRTDQNLPTDQQIVNYAANDDSSPGVSQLNGAKFGMQQNVSRFPQNASPTVSYFSQFPSPPVSTVFSTNQPYSFIPSHIRRTIPQPNHYAGTNIVGNTVMAATNTASNPSNLFVPNTFNYPTHSNNTLLSYVPNAPTEMPLCRNNNDSVTTSIPIFSNNVHSGFQSQTQLANTTMNTQHHVPVFPKCVSNVPPVVNAHYQQISLQDVQNLQTVSQNTFPESQTIPSGIPPPQNSSSYLSSQPPYISALPQSNRFQFQAPVAKPETVKDSADENIVRDFIAKAKLRGANFKEDKSTCMKIPEFQCLMKMSISLLTKLSACKNDLKNSINLDEEMWRKKWNYSKDLKMQFAEVHRKLSNNENLSHILIKLKKRVQKRKKICARRERYTRLQQKKKQDRALLHQKIDLWLETLREKDLQQKREGEMKREADSILSEVRRKIQEAKRAIEKLKIFLKLRQARKEHAQKKGMFIHSKSDAIFENKIAEMKEVMQKQLVDYEAEEKALTVMLETEQEGQLEAEAQWKSKQLKKHQEKKCHAILECLFRHSEEPSSNDPLYFFWQHYNAGNCDINSLLKIRHDWDIFLVPRDNEEGSGIPQHWVRPEAPSSDTWSLALEKS